VKKMSAPDNFPPRTGRQGIKTLARDAVSRHPLNAASSPGVNALRPPSLSFLGYRAAPFTGISAKSARSTRDAI